MFQNACATEADIKWGKRCEICQNLSAPILASYFTVVYIKYIFLFSVLRLNLEYPDELWRYLSCFDTCIILISVDIRREERKRAFIRLFTYQFTVWYLQKCSFVILMYFIIRQLHKNEQNLENRGCVENGWVTSDVRTVLGFVHVTWMTIFTERTTVGFDAV